jgi:hypothetical protein
MYIAGAKIYIARRKIYIARRKIYIARRKIYIARRKIYIASAKIEFSPVGGECFQAGLIIFRTASRSLLFLISGQITTDTHSGNILSLKASKDTFCLNIREVCSGRGFLSLHRKKNHFKEQ